MEDKDFVFYDGRTKEDVDKSLFSFLFRNKENYNFFIGDDFIHFVKKQDIKPNCKEQLYPKGTVNFNTNGQEIW